MYMTYVHLREKIASSERQERLHSKRTYLAFFLKKLLSDAISDDGTLSFFFITWTKNLFGICCAQLTKMSIYFMRVGKLHPPEDE